ncbi:NUDIX domain-containing protein [Aquimarina addita]|uniref:NUDIX domain-containing protein n=1 Tax=Aquimarina addita TaxID=870485 RepID=A0ABP6UPK6_9FLAO
MADELIDIVDSLGNQTGRIRLKSEAHRLGLYHKSVHIWFYTLRGELLLQKRAINKDTYPNLWDVSVAGHISAGETPEISAIREVEEEIGLKISIDDLEFLDIYLSKKEPAPGIVDNEFHHIYLSKLSIPLQKLKLQKEEVAAIKLLSIDDFKNELSNSLDKNKYVPHDESYFHLIIDEINKRIH